MPKFSRVILAIGALGLIGAIAAFWYVTHLFAPVSATPVSPTTFEIPKGQALQVIANRLAAEGYIRHPYVFRWEAQRQNIADRVQAGVFELSPSMTVTEIARQLILGTNDMTITIPEGWRHEEIADYLANQGLENFDKQEFLRLSAASEGTLFPARYDIPKDADAQAVYDLLTSTFDKKITTALAKEIAGSKYSFEEILTMASIVEREAKTNDKAIVAGILWNRYEIGMPLQVDATLQYVKGYNTRTGNWWTPPTAADKQLNSPYNTYQQAGLPPKPIANPGEAAVAAVLNPVASDDLFYIHDNQGKIHTAATLDEHNRNIDQYLR